MQVRTVSRIASRGRDSADAAAGLDVDRGRPPDSSPKTSRQDVAAASCIGETPGEERRLRVTILRARGVQRLRAEGEAGVPTSCSCTVIGRSSCRTVTQAAEGDDPEWNHDAIMPNFVDGDALLFGVWGETWGGLGVAMLDGRQLRKGLFAGELPLSRRGVALEAFLLVRVDVLEPQPQPVVAQATRKDEVRAASPAQKTQTPGGASAQRVVEARLVPVEVPEGAAPCCGVTEPALDAEEQQWAERQRVTGAVCRLVSYPAGECPQTQFLLRGGCGRRVRVAEVSDGSRLQRAQVRVGDILVSIDGRRDFGDQPAELLLASLSPPVVLVFMGFAGRPTAEVQVNSRGQRLGVRGGFFDGGRKAVQSLVDELVVFSGPAGASVTLASSSSPEGPRYGSPDRSAGGPPSCGLFELRRSEALGVLMGALSPRALAGAASPRASPSSRRPGGWSCQVAMPPPLGECGRVPGAVSLARRAAGAIAEPPPCPSPVRAAPPPQQAHPPRCEAVRPSPFARKGPGGGVGGASSPSRAHTGYWV